MPTIMLTTIITSLITAVLVCACKEFLIEMHRTKKQKQKRQKDFESVYSLTKVLVDDMIEDLRKKPLRRRFLVSDHYSHFESRPRFQYYGHFYKDLDIVGCVDILENYGFVEWLFDNEAIARNGNPSGFPLRYYRFKEEFLEFLDKME